MKLTFFTLAMAFLSLWVHRSAWLWGAFLVISYILAFQTCVVQPISLLPIGLLFVIFLVFKKPLTGKVRLFLVFIAILIAAGLNFHLFPGFQNWQVTKNLWVNYDKPFMGLFVLAFLLPLLRTPQEWIQMGIKATPWIFVTIFVMATLALFAGVIDWHVKIPSHFLTRVVSNLFLVTIPEEAFFRGFVQQEIERRLGPLAAIIGASLLFTAFHVGWTSSAAMLGFVFLASLFYGTVYQRVKAIESSILCHFMVNLLHMVFFTYHAA